MAEILERTESSYFNSFKILFQDVVNGKSMINHKLSGAARKIRFVECFLDLENNNGVVSFFY